MSEYKNREKLGNLGKIFEEQMKDDKELRETICAIIHEEKKGINPDSTTPPKEILKEVRKTAAEIAKEKERQEAKEKFRQSETSILKKLLEEKEIDKEQKEMIGQILEERGDISEEYFKEILNEILDEYEKQFKNKNLTNKNLEAKKDLVEYFFQDFGKNKSWIKEIEKEIKTNLEQGKTNLKEQIKMAIEEILEERRVKKIKTQKKRQ